MEQDYTQQINELNKELGEELKKWELLEMDPSNIQFNVFLIDAHINALLRFLIEKGIMVDEEYTLFFKKHMLENLKSSRERFASQAMRERKQASKVARPVRGIITPDGFRPV